MKLGAAPRLYSPKKKVMRRPSLVRALIVKFPSGISIGKVGTSLKRAKPIDSASRGHDGDLGDIGHGLVPRTWYAA